MVMNNPLECNPCRRPADGDPKKPGGWRSNVLTANEHGFTLIETLVAMGLFLGVLIPIGVTIGNLMLDGAANRLTLTLYAGQSEMSRIETKHDFTDGERSDERGFVVERIIHSSGDVMEIQISVVGMKWPGRSILVLHKSILRP